MSQRYFVCLRVRYPFMFDDYRCLCILVALGWQTGFAQLCAYIDRAGAAGVGFYWVQVKEKFGVIQVYWGFAKDSGPEHPGQDAEAVPREIRSIVDSAEHALGAVCIYSRTTPALLNNTGRRTLKLCALRNHQRERGNMPNPWEDCP